MKRRRSGSARAHLLTTITYRIGMREQRREYTSHFSSTIYALDLTVKPPHRRIRSSIVHDLLESGKIQRVAAYDGTEQVFKLAAPAES